MNTPAALSTCFPPNSNLTAKSAPPSNTRGNPDSLRQDHPFRMPISADSSVVKFPTLDEVCDMYIRRMLDLCGGHREATARVLGIGRTSLYRYLRKLDREKRETATRNRLQDQ
jgi:DNA-binding NtrC family response regulator